MDKWERRARKQQKNRERIKKHGKELGEIYKRQWEKRGKSGKDREGEAADLGFTG